MRRDASAVVVLGVNVGWMETREAEETRHPYIVINDLGSSGAIFADLGTGNSYGTFAVTASSSSPLTVTLDAAAIADINADRGGGSLSA